MSCDLNKTWISAYLDGEMPADERARRERHLAECAACSEELEGLRVSLRLLRGLPVEEPPAELRPRIMAAIAATRPGAWSRLLALLQPPAPMARWGLAGAGLAGAAIVGLTVARSAPPTPAAIPPARAPVVVAAQPPGPRPSAAPREAAKAQPRAPAPLAAKPAPIVRPAMVPDARTVRIANAAVRRVRPRLAALPTRRAEAAPRRAHSAPRPASRRPGAAMSQPAGPSAADGFDPFAPGTAPTAPAPDVQPEEPLTLMAAMPLVSSGGPEETTATSGDALSSLRQRLAEQRREVPVPAVESLGSSRNTRSLPVKFEF